MPFITGRRLPSQSSLNWQSNRGANWLLSHEIKSEWLMALIAILSMAFGFLLVAFPAPGVLSVVLIIWAFALVNAVLGSLTLGVFLLVLIFTGLEYQQGFAALHSIADIAPAIRNKLVEP